jgi:DNA-binding Xre family transcriptional regulator
MTMSYKKLWKLLIDLELSKKELANRSGLSQYTINKLTRSETVTTETLEKICYGLKVDIGDICEVINFDKYASKGEENN